MPTTHTVEIVQFAYSPELVTIKVNDSVKFVNRDRATHTATRDDAPAFNTGPLGKDEARTIRFDQVSGTNGFEYYCIPHPTMKGRVKVLAEIDPPLTHDPVKA